jgi:hypothetical protein
MVLGSIRGMLGLTTKRRWFYSPDGLRCLIGRSAILRPLSLAGLVRVLALHLERDTVNQDSVLNKVSMLDSERMSQHLPCPEWLSMA